MKTKRHILAVVSLTLLFVLPRAVSAQSSGHADSPKFYSLYYEDFKNKNYESALPSLRWILANDPGFPRKSDKNFERAVETYREIGVQQETDELRRTYLDSALVFFETAVPVLQEAGAEIDPWEWTLERGKFIFENLEYLADLEPEIAKQYIMAFEMDPERLDQYYLEYILADFVQNQEDKESAVAFLNQIEAEVVEQEGIPELLSKWRGGLFTSPEERYDYLMTQLADEPENVDLLSEILDIAIDEEWREVVYEMGERVLAVEPTPK
ncbi:MAG: hypothetical protein HKN13_02535, partial [Rhodothermales bacterium]|nr:hypothetical protein [Rhodothermales bacterium]